MLLTSDRQIQLVSRHVSVRWLDLNSDVQPWQPAVTWVYSLILLLSDNLSALQWYLQVLLLIANLIPSAG